MVIPRQPDLDAVRTLGNVWKLLVLTDYLRTQPTANLRAEGNSLRNLSMQHFPKSLVGQKPDSVCSLPFRFLLTPLIIIEITEDPLGVLTAKPTSIQNLQAVGGRCSRSVGVVFLLHLLRFFLERRCHRQTDGSAWTRSTNV